MKTPYFVKCARFKCHDLKVKVLGWLVDHMSWYKTGKQLSPSFQYFIHIIGGYECNMAVGHISIYTDVPHFYKHYQKSYLRKKLSVFMYVRIFGQSSLKTRVLWSIPARTGPSVFAMAQTRNVPFFVCNFPLFCPFLGLFFKKFGSNPSPRPGPDPK